MTTTKLDSFIEANRSDMLTDLTDIVNDLKATMQGDPEEYTDWGSEEPSIDIRLCIDSTRRGEMTWIIRTGSSDYDQYHSDYCAALSVGLDTKSEELLTDLINQLDDNS